MKDENRSLSSFPDGEFDQEAMLEAWQALEQEEAERVLSEYQWLVNAVTSFFPQDSLALEDADTHVHLLHTVVEGEKPIGVLIYRLRKIPDKEADYSAWGKELRETLGIPECLVVDTETNRFEAPATLETDKSFLEIPVDALKEKIAALREELKRRAKLRSLRESL